MPSRKTASQAGRARRRAASNRATRRIVVRRVQIEGLDRPAAEALYLELRRLAREADLVIRRFTVERRS